MLLDIFQAAPAYMAASAKWLNANQGVVGVGIFLLTLLLGWLSGIFAGLRRKPKFRIDFIPGPTFVCIYPTGDVVGEYDVHRVGIALYLSIANIGSAPSSLHAIHIGYRWNAIPLTRAWFRNGLLRFWLKERTAALADFQIKIGESVKVYPFLFQKNSLSPVQSETFLEPGRSTVGVVYFEQSDSWGACQPLVQNGHVFLAVRIIDVFGGRYTRTIRVPALALEEARRFNPSFGGTLATLHGKPLPYDKANSHSFGGES